MTATLEKANEALRSAVQERLAATPADDPKMVGYSHEPRTIVSSHWDNADIAKAEAMKKLHDATAAIAETAPPEPRRFYGSTEESQTAHPSSRAFFALCDELKKIHRTKSIGYGSPDDPLANIRNGAYFVGIEPWRAAMVRLSDKVTRLQTYCRTGSLPLESFEDNCIDLASYALLTLLMHREEHGGRAAD